MWNEDVLKLRETTLTEKHERSKHFLFIARSKLYKYLLQLIKKLHLQKLNTRPGGQGCFHCTVTFFISEIKKSVFHILFSFEFVTELLKFHMKHKIDRSVSV